MPPWQILLYMLINEDHSIGQYVELSFVPYGQHLCLEIDQILGDRLVTYSAAPLSANIVSSDTARGKITL